MESHGADDLADLSMIIGLPKQNFEKDESQPNIWRYYIYIYILYIYIFIPLDPKTILRKKNTFLSPKKYGLPIKRNVLGSYIYHFLSIQARTTENTHPSAIRPTEPPEFGPWFVDSSGHCVRSLVGDAGVFFSRKKWRHPKIGSNLHPPKNLRWRHGETTIWMKVYFLLVLLKMMIFQCRHGGAKIQQPSNLPLGAGTGSFVPFSQSHLILSTLWFWGFWGSKTLPI